MDHSAVATTNGKQPRQKFKCPLKAQLERKLELHIFFFTLNPPPFLLKPGELKL